MGENFSSWVQLNVIIDDIGDAAPIKVVTQDGRKSHGLSLNIFYDRCHHE
jgi:hypothetical protein